MLTDCRTTQTVEIVFPAGLPGFPYSHRFRVEPTPAGNSFLLLTCLEDPDVCFVVVAPWVFYPEYDFELDAPTSARLGLSTVEDAVVLAVVTLRDRPADSTLNLLGPIVVNRFTRHAAQVVPIVCYSVCAPLALRS